MSDRRKAAAVAAAGWLARPVRCALRRSPSINNAARRATQTNRLLPAAGESMSLRQGVTGRPSMTTGAVPCAERSFYFCQPSPCRGRSRYGFLPDSCSKSRVSSDGKVDSLLWWLLCTWTRHRSPCAPCAVAYEINFLEG